MNTISTGFTHGIPTPLPVMTTDQEEVYRKLCRRVGKPDLRPYHPGFPFIFEVSVPLEFNFLGDMRFYCLQCNEEWIVGGIFRLGYTHARQFIEAIEREFEPHRHPPEVLEILDPSGVPLAYETPVG